MRKLFFTLLIFGIISCNSNQNESTPPSAAEIRTNCYEIQSESDTVTLRLELKGEDVTGTLSYKYYQKDKNEGSVKGKLKDSIVIADYSFLSEGTQSIRQIAFRLSGNDVIEGYGPMIEQGGKMVFTNIDSVNFDPQFLITGISCN